MAAANEMFASHAKHAQSSLTLRTASAGLLHTWVNVGCVDDCFIAAYCRLLYPLGVHIFSPW